MWGYLLCLTWLGVSDVASAAALRREHKVKKGDDKVQEKDLLDMLTSLNEIVVSMDKEYKAFREMSNARETSCQSTQTSLEKSLKDGNRSLQTAQQELSEAMTEVDSIQGGVDTLQDQMKAIEGQISDLQAQLVKLRSDRQAVVARDFGYAQQVQAILAKAQQRISQVWTRSGAHKMNSEELEATKADDGNSLAALASELSHRDDSPDDDRRTEVNEGQKALDADAASVNEAAKKAREAFELQELKLMDLIKAKRQELVPLQSSMAKRQPELADQLRKISEANRSVAMTSQGLKRDKKVLERAQAKCAVLSKAKKFETDKRPESRVQVIMAISFLKAMARASGIELNPGAQGPSFLQLESKDSDLSEAVRSALRHIESIDGNNYRVDLKDDSAADEVFAIPESNLVQVGAEKAEAKEAADSLKNVKEMIANLIASLREEQNQDQEKQKFCAEQEKKAQDGMKKLKTTQEEVEESKRWAEQAVSDLQEQARFMEAEVQLLKQAKTSSLAELAREAKRIHDEVKNHDASQDVMSKSQQVLVSQCKLSEDDTSSNCAEANAALRRANIGLKALDEYLTNYLAEFTKVSEAQKADIEVTLTTQEASLFQAQADLNRRKDELAQLKSDVVTAKENAILAGKAESALSTNCGPKVSSMEATIASRQEQIEQLKNAVKVLDGQAFV